VIRNVFDPNWHATLDGQPVPLLRADYLLQGVMVPKGRHTIELSYDDPTIWAGVLGSLAALLALLTLAVVVPLRGSARPVGQSAPDANRDRRRGEAP